MTARTEKPGPGPGAVSTLHVGNPRADWCAICRAYTRLIGDMLLLTPDGVSTLGTWAGCEICDDPTDQEAPRG